MKHLFSFIILGLIALGFILQQALIPLNSVEAFEEKFPVCGEQANAQDISCPQLEKAILSSTVRIKFQTWVVADNETGYTIQADNSHATVKEGRYLVTHNHFEVPLSIRQPEGMPEIFTKIFLYDAAGELRYEGSLTDFSIIIDEAETLVLAHREAGFLESLGFTSAEFINWEELELKAGMNVAQIDWDGERTRVDWMTIDNFEVEMGVPQIDLSDGAKKGASGGGIFWNGYHIANNWRVEKMLDGAGNVIIQTTTAALNSELVAS